MGKNPLWRLSSRKSSRLTALDQPDLAWHHSFCGTRSAMVGWFCCIPRCQQFCLPSDIWLLWTWSIDKILRNLLNVDVSIAKPSPMFMILGLSINIHNKPFINGSIPVNHEWSPKKLRVRVSRMIVNLLPHWLLKWASNFMANSYQWGGTIIKYHVGKNQRSFLC